MKRITTIAPIALFMLTLLASCGNGGLEGTYVACNEAAKQTTFAKFVFAEENVDVGFLDKVLTKTQFKQHTVKIYVGMMGIAMPVNYECSYSLKGDKLTITEGIPGVSGGSFELTYNKEYDYISMNVDYAFNMLDGLFSAMGGKNTFDALKNNNDIRKKATPVWRKEGTFDPNDPCDENDEGKPDLPDDDEPDGEGSGGDWNYNPNVFYQGLAETCAVYSSEAYTKEYIEEHFKKDGYTTSTFPNDKEDGIGYTLAHKIVNGNETLLVVVIRGTVKNEWYGNMNIGKNSERHESFEKANVKLQEGINSYIQDMKKKNINLLITGHSRGAAVGNLLAVDSKESKWCTNGNIKNVYAYLFATPNVSTKFSKTEYNNIFNFCFEDDFITQVPLDQKFIPEYGYEWGYGKSGITYIAVAEGLYNISPKFKEKVDKYIKDLYNRKPNFDYKATQEVLGAFLKLAPTVSDYYDKNHFIGLGHFPSHISLYDFMRDYVAKAANGNFTAIVGLIDATGPLDAFHKIAGFFITGKVFQNYIGDTHNMWTYHSALTTNGFLTK